MATQIVIEPVGSWEQVTDYGLETAPIAEQIEFALEKLAGLSVTDAEWDTTRVFILDTATGERTDISVTLAKRMADEWLEDGAEYYEEDETWNAPAFAQSHAPNYLTHWFNENFADAQEYAKGADYYYGAPPRL